MTILPEPGGRFRRVCPYCHCPLAWRLFGGAPGTGPEDAPVERPFCWLHGPLVLWRVVDYHHAGGRPAIVCVAHLSEEIGGRLLPNPIPVQLAHPASARWKRATRPVTGEAERLQRPLFPTLDLARLSNRRAA